MMSNELTPLSKFEPLAPPCELMHTDKCCRICLDADDPETMIAPCRCKGSSKWVHRYCLDQWRVHEKDRAFSQCTECGFEYHLRAKPVKPWKKAQFCLFVSRDICMMTVLSQLLIAFLGWIVSVIDQNRAIVDWLPGECSDSSGLCVRQVVSVYYLCGWFLLLVVMGMYGSGLLCSHGCKPQAAVSSLTDQSDTSSYDRARSYRSRRARNMHDGGCCCVCPDSSPYGYYYASPPGDCDCCCCCEDPNCCPDAPSGHSHGNNCDGDNMGPVLTILLVVAIILAIIGFVVGVVLSAIAFQRVIQRHIFLLQKRRLAADFVVVDLDAYSDLEALPPPSQIEVPGAPLRELDDRDKNHLKKLGLMDSDA